MEFLLTCISTKYSLLKDHWYQAQHDRDEIACPLTTLGSHQKPKEDQGGLLCLLNENGEIRSGVEMSMPAGMTFSERGVFVAALDTIHEMTPDLSVVQSDVVSLPSFNLLHSLSRTKQGYLVASTGLDALLEFSRDGQLLWDWWATEHGFIHTPTGEPRQLDTRADHRGRKYGTLAQTTHVNAAVELPDGRILATLFHQGMVIAIERETGSWQPIVEGLDHPHAVQVVSEDYFTVADTRHGRALLVQIKDGKGRIEAEVQADTNWLQDSRYDARYDHWIMVDGQHSRITLRSGISGEREVARFDLNPEWRLYEVLPL